MKRRSRGSTLIVGMIFLVLLTLVSITAFQLQRANMAVTTNSQYRAEALAYADAAASLALGSTAFFNTPTSAIPPNNYSACSGTNTFCGDMNGDGTAEYRVTLNPAPFCKSALTLSNAGLDLSDPEDLGCASGVSQDFGVSGAASGGSLCANSLWEITAVSTNTATGTAVTLRTGTQVRVSVDNIATSCP